MGVRRGTSRTRGSVKTVKVLLRRIVQSIVMVSLASRSWQEQSVDVGDGGVGCAYKKGICSMCGKQILDTSGYVMSSK